MGWSGYRKHNIILFWPYWYAAKYYMIKYHHHPLFWKRCFLPPWARVRCLPQGRQSNLWQHFTRFNSTTSGKIAISQLSTHGYWSKILAGFPRILENLESHGIWLTQISNLEILENKAFLNKIPGKSWKIKIVDSLKIMENKNYGL